MILQRLVEYYKRLAKSGPSEIPQHGFQSKEIPFVIVLDSSGCCKGVDDTRTSEGKVRRGRVFEVPHEVKRTSTNAWKKSNLLWDNAAYVLGYSADGADDAKRKHGSFIKKFNDVFPDPDFDVGIRALKSFLEKDDLSDIQAHPAWKDIEKSGGNISFRLGSEQRLICQRDLVKKRILGLDEEGAPEEKQICLISGELEAPVQLHTVIKGVRHAHPMGANIVSFNLPAFRSYGKKQGLNAPVGKKAEFAYTTALNALLARNSRQKMQVGDATTVFWAQRESPVEGWFAAFFTDDWRDSEQEHLAIKALYESPATGKPPILGDLTPFYVLGLSPNASRLAIRFWYEATVGETIKHILQHFDDCRIVHSPKQPDRLSIFRLLLSIAQQRKSENIQPNLSGDMMSSILAGRPYPRTLLSSAVRRCRAEQEVTYERAVLIKASLVRLARLDKTNPKEVSVKLDKSNLSVGYRLGRLFAVLEKTQEEASPGINATIRDRYYGAASGTPVTVFSTLLKLKNHHLAKLDNRRRAVNLERIISEIMEGITTFPSHLTLDEQGRFAIGYYHQRADLFSSKGKNEKGEEA